MKVFISGKMTGLPTGEVFVKFGQAEYWLKGQGHETVNPLRLCSADWDKRQRMRTCLSELVKCDAICLLHDWGESPESQTEYYVAQMLDMKSFTFRPSRNNRQL